MDHPSTPTPHLGRGDLAVTAPNARTLHQSRCRDPYCPSCEDAAEARKDADQEPYDDNGARADEYERGLGL